MFDFKNPLQNVRQYLDRINLIFYFIVSVPLILFVIVYLRYEQAGGLRSTTADSFQLSTHALLPLLAVASLLGSWWYYRQKRRSGAASADLSTKLSLFYSTLIRRYLILMAGSLLAVLGLYLTGEQLFAALYTVMLIASSLIRPTPSRLVRDFRLSKEEQETLSQPNA